MLAVKHNIALIVLAAGLSKRMGVPKPLLPVGEIPAVSRCVSIAKSAGVPEIVVVTGHKSDETLTLLQKSAPDVRTVYNKDYKSGMFSSVLAGISVLPENIDGFLLLPSDCCAVSPKTIETVIYEFEKAGRKFIVRPKMGEGSRGHPPLIPSMLRAQLHSYSGENGLKGFLRSFDSIELEINDPGMNLDMDTPTDYEKLLNYLGFSGYPTPAHSLEILEECGTPADIVSHGQQVAALSLKIARLMSEVHGVNIDLELLESACLLHDIKRMEPDHASAGKKFLLKLGYPKAAKIVGTHMDISEIRAQIGESEILYLADKLCRRGKIVRLEDTIHMQRQKFSENPDALKQAELRIENAKTILNLLEKQYGIRSLDDEKVM